MLFFLPFLASYVIINPFFLIIMLCWVSPIVAPFKTSLDTLKRFFIAWGMYRNLVSFTICQSCSFIFADTFRSYFIFWPFTTVTLISHFSTSIMPLWLCVICDDVPLSPNHSLGSSSLFSSYTSPHNVDFMNSLSTSFSFSFPFFSQQSTSL